MTFHVASTLRAFGALCVLPAYFCLYVWVCVIAWKMCTEQTSEAASILSHSKMLGNVYTENRTLGKSVVDEKLSESSTLCTESLTYKTNAKWRDFWEYWILLSFLAATVKWSAWEKERERERQYEMRYTRNASKWMNDKSATHTKSPCCSPERKEGISLYEKSFRCLYGFSYDACYGCQVTLAENWKLNNNISNNGQMEYTHTQNTNL